MIYPQSLATPYGATPYINTLNTLYGNVPQNPTLMQNWSPFPVLSPQINSQQALQQQALQQQQAAHQLALQLAAQQLATQQLTGQPFAGQPLAQLAPTAASALPSQPPPFAAWTQQGGQYGNLAPQAQSTQQLPLYQLAYYHYQLAQQLAQLAAQQQPGAPGYFGNVFGGQAIPGQQFNPGQQFGLGQQFIPNQYGQNVAPGMTVH